ncbi:hypothetical protein SAMN05444008_10749 [Cnuella takakiae]|uniref:Tetratricopeptide repeat-containing protein n=1 Tax=Cnuella takakiae TaxID=1302690 RepID=A0A1M5AXS7_9BACT|nr:hypothetical protein [Cnuella takakiae]OLY93262.1 hypothetical protein BUE76_16235 [Cnuella takakiae]SHF35013.1 hypothetical protein SAMN05444008_10749 [Cnuella takakiae]
MEAGAQTGFNLDIKKPEPYENRQLKAEKSGAKKFTAPRRFMQNLYTHYNYFFNANNKLNEVLLRAKEGHKDDYSQLLAYYNYNLEATKADKQQLDSVMYKSRTGIVMHDLRNDWIDDLYLLWGQAYFLQKELDSAYQMFQFINYAFAPKEDDGYYRYIGSRMDGGNARSIVTQEQETFLKRLTTDPPSRNNAFLWQARTLTEANAFGQAGSLLSTLRLDPNFPARLLPMLEEVQGYWFYKQGVWDSAALHLVQALPQAQNKGEKARWEYLAGQLFELSGKREQARQYYAAAIDHTIDPVMDIWGRLNMIKLNKEGGEDFIAKNIEELGNMARKERFAPYRDAIYNMMARMELERGNPEAARNYMLKASKYISELPGARNNTFLNLADLLYDQKQYVPSAAFYDSVEVSQLADTLQTRIVHRKDYLQTLVAGTGTIQRQDSLQRLASLPEAERTDALKKIARQLRKQRGLKEEETTTASGGARDIRNAEAVAPALFNDQGNKGEWYFYNPSSRTSGAASFKQVWGNRPNVDNWRRASSVAAQLQEEESVNAVNSTRGNPVPQADPLANGSINAASLLETLPTTPAKLKLSNDSIRNALFSNGMVYLTEIEDYPAAIATFEELRRRFPDDADMSEVLFRLQYAYNKTARQDSAQHLKSAVVSQYPTSRQATILRTGKDPEDKTPSPESTKAYEAVYDMFIEGRFAAAEAAKKRADSIYQTNYWNPQLLFIESVYFIKKREDNTAIDILNTLIKQNPEAPIAEKAMNLIEVLGRRAQIEEELRNLKLDPITEEKPAVVAAPVKKETPKPEEPKKEEPAPVVKTPEPQPKKAEPPVVKQEEKPAPAVVQTPPPVAKVPEKAAPVQKPVEQPKPTPVKPEEQPVVVKPAVQELQLPSVKRDTTQAQQAELKDVAKKGKETAKVSTTPVAQTPVSLPKQNSAGYSFYPDLPHYAVVILNKVDNIYGNEARNAFTRYNRDKGLGAQQNIQLLPLDGENKLLLIGGFSDVLGAVNYVQQVKPVAGSTIVPWLKADKYSFTIISEPNLEFLKSQPDLKAYQKFLESTPVKL